MIIVATVVAPVFGVILLGLMVGRARYLADGAQKALIEFVFRIAIPALLFRTMVEAPAAAASPLALWAAFFGSIAIVWLAATILSLVVLRRPAADGAVIAFGSIFGNLVLLGLPLSLTAIGPEAATPMALIFFVEFPLLWLVATAHLMLTAPGGGARITEVLAKLGADLLTNPIVIALLAGALWRLAGFGIHPIPRRTLELLGQAATPGSLFALGLSLAAFEVRGQVRTVVTIVLLKLLALPAIAWIAAFHVFTLPRIWASVVVLFAAMPTGAVPFLFATRYGRAIHSTSAAIALGVALSSVTISVVLTLLFPEGPPALGR